MGSALKAADLEKQVCATPVGSLPLASWLFLAASCLLYPPRTHRTLAMPRPPAFICVHLGVNNAGAVSYPCSYTDFCTLTSWVEPCESAFTLSRRKARRKR